MSNGVPELLESFGIEIEFNHPIQADMISAVRNLQLPVKITYDASAEQRIPTELTTNLPIIGDTEMFRKNTSVRGGELVTTVWNNRESKKALGYLIQITNLFRENGEENESTTAGIHFHQSYANNLDALINVMTVFGHLEKFFFSIGGMGYKHRGEMSDAVYYRPITGAGPIVVPVPYKKWAQCFSIESLQKSKSVEEFFQRYGDSTGAQRDVRYPVPRYHYINLYNLVSGRNTIEIRVFNKTLDPLKIWATLQLFLAVGKYCFQNSPEKIVKQGLSDSQSVFDPLQENLLDTLERIIKVVEFPNSQVVDVLFDVVEASKEATLESKLIRSHLHDRHTVAEIWRGFNYIPQPLVDESEIKHPIYVDRYVESGEINPQTRYSSIGRMREGTVSQGRSSNQVSPIGQYEYSVRSGSEREIIEEEPISSFDQFVRSMESPVDEPEERANIWSTITMPQPSSESTRARIRRLEEELRNRTRS